ncbi:hypothetical protein BIW11_00765 [Tropilaelaps mercedesae]|uniref:Uncharacterized protein n=1 Tax=Tropilaelaps mercedesae TaxID=418985 RepID=A0A1V9XPQ9_9ACAR|nr:hypothetical protein BIW11_00765 [Tropilaelaps mercedesae]
MDSRFVLCCWAVLTAPPHQAELDGVGRTSSEERRERRVADHDGRRDKYRRIRAELVRSRSSSCNQPANALPAVPCLICEKTRWPPSLAGGEHNFESGTGSPCRARSVDFVSLPRGDRITSTQSDTLGAKRVIRNLARPNASHGALRYFFRQLLWCRHISFRRTAASVHLYLLWTGVRDSE